MNTSNNFADEILNNTFAGVKDIVNADAVNELLDNFNLNWRVAKKPLYLGDGSETEFYAIQREDTKQRFTTCKDDYTIFQNSELAEMLIRISEKTGYDLHKGGFFAGGAKVYVQIKSPNIITNLGENHDTVKGFLTGINTHDGTGSLRWGTANLTISCYNTFMYAMKQLKNKVRHTSSIHMKVEDAIAELHKVETVERALFDTFIKLSEIPLTREIGTRIVKDVTGVDVTLPQSEAQNKYSTQALNKSKTLLNSIAQETKQKGQTLWGLFSGVTEFTTHRAGTSKATQDDRLQSTYIGTSFTTNNDVFKTIATYGKVLQNI